MAEIAAIGWGVSAVGWFVSPYITRLLDKAYAHIKPGKAKKKIQHLVNHTVPRLKLILEAAESSEHKHLFEELLSDLRSAFYATEDILDEVEYVSRHKSGSKRKFDSCGIGPSNQSIGTSPTIPGPLSKLLKENVTRIEELIEEAHKTIESANLHSNIGSDKHIATATAKILQGPTLSVPIGKVTGRDEALKEITDILRQKEEPNTCLSVIGIVGIPGSGKTTLAQCVCKSERNGSYFELVMWVHVSEYFTVQTIYGEMFEQAWQKFGEKDKKCPQYNCPDMLREELENLLNGKRFFLVLDDIWFSKEQVIEKLKLLLCPLKVGEKGSRILVTSRQDSLSCLGPDVISTTYKIPDLDDGVFLKLFMHYALGNKSVNEKYLEKLESIGAEIAEKLRKSPLLARVVGGTLFQKRTIEVRDWISVRDQNLLDKHMGALWWSYKHLGEQVRRCFSYCSIFPRRHHLRRDELINFWVAEGFIYTTDGGQEAEDVGGDYFDELLSTSFLLPGGEDYDGEYFVIHDLLHDLAVKVAGSDCFKVENEWTGNISPDVRHLYIQNCNASMITGHIIKLKNLRSLIIYEIDHGISKQDLSEMFSKLSKLRVLIFTARRYTPNKLIFPESIGSLKHLRYLGIRKFADEITMPSTFAKLHLLQVLDLGVAYDEVDSSFAENIIKLVDLWHVIGEIVCFPNIGRLSSLRTMPKLSLYDQQEGSQGYELHQLKHLNKLQGKLSIECLEFVHSKEEAMEAKLADKEQLTELELSWSEEYFPQDGVQAQVQADVFEALFPPEYLKTLSVHNYHGSGRRYPSWMMGSQESTMHLHKLELSSCSEPDSNTGHFFIPVSSLVLWNCVWDVLPNNMDGLESLELQDSIIPSNMDDLTSLKRLIIGHRDHYYFETLPKLPSSLEYLEITGWDLMGNNKHWERIKDVPNKVIDGLPINGAEDFPWTEGSPDPWEMGWLPKDWSSSSCSAEGDSEGSIGGADMV